MWSVQEDQILHTTEMMERDQNTEQTVKIKFCSPHYLDDEFRMSCVARGLEGKVQAQGTFPHCILYLCWQEATTQGHLDDIWRAETVDMGKSQCLGISELWS